MKHLYIELSDLDKNNEIATVEAVVADIKKGFESGTIDGREWYKIDISPEHHLYKMWLPNDFEDKVFELESKIEDLQLEIEDLKEKLSTYEVEDDSG